jgi:hypothetical protein
LWIAKFFTGSLGPCNFVDLYICKKDNPGMSSFVEDVNSCVRGTHKKLSHQDNWPCLLFFSDRFLLPTKIDVKFQIEKVQDHVPKRVN